MRLVRLVRSRALASVALSVVVSLAIAACADLTTQPTPPAAPHALPGLLGIQFDLPPGQAKKLLYCPTQIAQRTDGIIGPEGGTLAVPGASIAIPAGAVADSTHFVVEMPISLYAEVRIRPDSSDHYQFAQPVVIGISYGNCAINPSLQRQLEGISSSYVGAYVDPATYEVLQLMPSYMDTAARIVYLSTDHLSSYIVAY